VIIDGVWIQSQRVRVTLRLVVYHKSVRLGDKPLETHEKYYFFKLNTWCRSPYITSSLSRGRVCHLQLLLVLASAVISRSESCGIYGNILMSQTRGTPKLEVQVPVFISPRIRVAQLYPPGTGFLDNQLKVKVKSYFTTGGLLPISSSWRQVPWDPRSEIFSCELLR
jgi:hypothetical protein